MKYLPELDGSRIKPVVSYYRKMRRRLIFLPLIFSRKRFCPGLFVLALLSLPAQSAPPELTQPTPQTFVILRHGEKPPSGLGQLNCRGLNRALALPEVLLSRFGRPTSIYAPSPTVLKQDRGGVFAYVRPLATIEPLAIRVGLPLNLDHAFTAVEPQAADLLKAGAGVHIIAWEHHLATKLAQALLKQAGASPEQVARVPAWNSDDFDSLYVVEVRRTEGQPTHAEFHIEAENLNDLPESCPTFLNSQGELKQ